MAKPTQTRIAVVGGGPAGLAAAALLAGEGVACVSIAPESSTADPRTVALMAPSLRMLERIGVWTPDLKAQSAPLKHLEILDEMGELVSAPQLLFSAEEVGLESFGWNIPLAVLVPALQRRLGVLGVLRVAATVTHVTLDAAGVVLALSDGQTVTAQAVVAADGAKSLLRTSAGIDTSAWSFAQEALVTNFSHSGEHGNVSTERHKPGGAFTTVPLPGKRSSLVWMDTPENIAAAMTRPVGKLAGDIQLRVGARLGLVSDVMPPRTFPMRGVRAKQFAARRTYLVGEAAHAFPPIGAQGLNMSLRDVGHVVDVVMAHDDAGGDVAMAEYHSARIGEVVQRQGVITIMNQSMLADLLPLHLLRATSLAVVAQFPPLRNLVMREGLAPTHNLPYAMRA